MYNHVGVMGCLKEKPFVIKGVNNKWIYCMKLEVEKRNSDMSEPIYNELEFVMWKGKYLQILEDDFYMGKHMMVNGYLENIEYIEDNELKSKMMIIVEGIDFLSKYSL